MPTIMGILSRSRQKCPREHWVLGYLDWSWLLSPILLLVAITLALQVLMFRPNETEMGLMGLAFLTFWLSVATNVLDSGLRIAVRIHRAGRDWRRFSKVRIGTLWITILLQAVSIWTFTK